MGEAAVKLTEKELEIQKQIQEIEQKQLKLEQEKSDKLMSSGQPAWSFPTIGNKSDSFEQKTLGQFGCRNLKQLIETNTCAPRFRHVGYEYKAAVQALKENVDINRWIAQRFYEGTKDSEGSVSVCKAATETNFYKEEVEYMVKAFSTGVSAEGGAWVPTAISSQYIPEFELDKQVPGLFREIKMPTNPYKLSVKTSNTTARIAAESASLVPQSFSVGTIDFDSTKYAEYFPIPEELNEDSAPDFLRIAREELTESQIRAMTEVILNGDTTGTHMDDDTDTGAADLAQKGAKGLRKLALENSANGAVVTFSSGVTVAKLDEMRTAAGKFGIGVKDLCYAFSPSGYHQAVNLTEVSSVDQIGNAATLITGALAVFRGVPIIVSEFVREDVDGTGVNVNAAANDKGLVYLVNKRRFFVGMRRPIKLRMMLDLPNQDRWLLSSLSRWDFQGHAQDANEQSSIIGIDVTI